MGHMGKRKANVWHIKLKKEDFPRNKATGHVLGDLKAL